MDAARTIVAVAIVGAVGAGAYFVFKSISRPTDQTSESCSGDWTDWVNPACWLGGITTTVSNEANAATNELNTILIIIALVIVLVIGLLAFGSQTGHIASAARLLA